MKKSIALALSFLLVMAADAQISIIGPATPAGDWVTDYDMVQDAGDSAIWTRSIYLGNGVVKFRKNHDWVLNWGDDVFPTGIGILDGPNIPADPGFYLVRFDTSTLAYSFSQGFVGINNESPNVALDISGAFAHRTAHLDVTSNAATVPPNVSLVNLVGAPTGAVYLETFPGIDGQRLIIHNSITTGQPASFGGTYDIIAGGTIELVYVNAVGWKITTGGGGSDIFWSQTGATDAISNTNAGGFYSENPVIVNSDPGPLPVPVSGLGTRLMWMPEKSAMRVGTVLGPKWDTDSIGTWSFASGYDTKAKGIFSTAVGTVSSATGASSMAMNYSTLASGENAIAMNSVTTASGANSASMGYTTKAMGWASLAIGNSTLARSYASLAMGRYNDTIAGSTQNNWVSVDPLLTIGNGSTPTTRNNALTIYKNGNIVAKKLVATNSDPGTVPLPVNGVGTRMMWIPDKSSFRAGTVAGTKWDADSTGTWSFAGGYDTKAKGIASTAFGTISSATGISSMAMNWNTLASGENSVAMNSETKASGNNTTSMGYNTKAMGWESVSIGNSTYARSYASLAIGRYNDTIVGSSHNSWIPTDPLLTIGNGSGSTVRHNALTIYKNGNLLAKNPTTVTIDPGSLPLPVSGAGTRLMWIPEKSAFRAGTVAGTQWDADSIGGWSFAAGKNNISKGQTSMTFGESNSAAGISSTAFGGFNKASGDYSTSMGSYTKASGTNSTALGTSTHARSFSSVVFGMWNDTIAGSSRDSWVPSDPLLTVGNGFGDTYRSNALTIFKNGTMVGKRLDPLMTDPGVVALPLSGTGTRMMWLTEKSAFRVGTVTGTQWDATNIGGWSFASGFDTRATGISSTALGIRTHASGAASTVFGEGSFASAHASTAFGYETRATHFYSTSLGILTRATGISSVASGEETRVNSYASLGIGQYNDTIVGSNPNVWVATDPLLMLGNGTGHSSRSNALTIYKNGNLLSKNPTAVTTDPGSLPVPVSGEGTRLMWIPEKSAFRAGTVIADHWDANNIGTQSFAGGYNTQAKGYRSTAFGGNTKALGISSTALGALTFASGDYSTALGGITTASGDFSTAIGYYADARSYSSLAIGSWNDTIAGSNPTAWVPTDPLLTVGNGTVSARQNAMTIYKNGNTDISGYTRLGTSAESAPRIKMKEFSSTTAATNNGSIPIPHGLNSSKIIGVEALVEYSTGSFVPVAYTYSPELNFNYLITATDIFIVNNASTCAGTSICNKPVKVVVTYKE